MIIRPLRPEDLPALSRLNPNYVATSELVVEREQDGLNVTFRITERPRKRAYVKREGYSFDLNYQGDLQRRMNMGRGLYLAATDEQAGVVGFLDLDIDSWRPATVIQWLIVDQPWRGKGIGRALIEQALTWTAAMGLDAIMLETQSTNIDACRFYLRMGFSISGLQHPFYFDKRVAEEKAIFWVYEL
jgi:streptothricin acetyltransferase